MLRELGVTSLRLVVAARGVVVHSVLCRSGGGSGQPDGRARQRGIPFLAGGLAARVLEITAAAGGAAKTAFPSAGGEAF